MVTHDRGVVRGGLPPLNVNSYEFGPDVSYETERYTITNNTSFAFFMGRAIWS